jgi:hypothetical protein
VFYEGIGFKSPKDIDSRHFGSSRLVRFLSQPTRTTMEAATWLR